MEKKSFVKRIINIFKGKKTTVKDEKPIELKATKSANVVAKQMGCVQYWAPIPGKLPNQRQKRKLIRQTV